MEKELKRNILYPLNLQSMGRRELLEQSSVQYKQKQKHFMSRVAQYAGAQGNCEEMH